MARPRIVGVRLVGIRLFVKDIAQAKKAGKQQGQGYQTVIRAWVARKAEEMRAAEQRE